MRTGQGLCHQSGASLETGWKTPHLFTSLGVFPHTVDFVLQVQPSKDRSVREVGWVLFSFLTFSTRPCLSQFTEPITNDKINWKLFNFKINLNALKWPKNCVLVRLYIYKIEVAGDLVQKSTYANVVACSYT